MADLEYTIKSKSDDSGAKEAGESFKQTSKAAETAKASMEKLGPAEEELGKETQKLTEEKREFIQQLKALGHSLPGVTELVHAAKHPFTILAIAIGIGIEALKRWVDAIKEAAVASSEIDQMIKPLDHFQAGAAEAAVHAAEFAHALALIGQESGTAADSLKRLESREEALSRLHEEKQSARQRLEKADVRERAARGDISPVQEARSLAAIDLKYQQAADAEKLRKFDREIQLKSAAATQTNSELAAERAAKARADQNVAELTQRESHRAQMAGETDSIQKKRLEQIDKDIAENVGRQASIPFNLPGGAPKGLLGKHFTAEDLEQERIALEQEKQFIEAAAKAREQAKITGAGELSAAVREQQEAEEKIRSLTTQHRTYADSIADLRVTRADTAAATQEVGALRSAASQREVAAGEIGLGRRAAESYITTDRQIRERREHGQDESQLLLQQQENIKILKDIQVQLGTAFESIRRQIQGANARLDNLN